VKVRTFVMKGTGAQTRPSDKVRCTLGGDWSHLGLP
jgi:hypothetical protein